MVSQGTASTQSQLVDQMYIQSRSGLILTALVTLVLGIAAWQGPAGLSGASAKTVMTWWVVSGLVLHYRTIITIRQRRSAGANGDWRRFRRLFSVGASLSGLCWGLGGILLVHELPPGGDAIVLLIIAAMAVSAIPYLAMHLETYLGYLVFSTVPLVIGLAIDNPSTQLISAFVVLFVLGIWRAAVRFNELLVSTLELQSKSERLAAQIHDANSSLAAANRRLAHDVEEREKTAIELQHARDIAETANVAKSQFLSRMSHELRTPLNAILGFCELLSVLPADEIRKQRKGHLANIQASGKHLLSLIDDVLDVARLESGEFEIRPELVSVSEVISECLVILRPQLKERKINIKVDHSDNEHPVISTDRLRLRQILLNLVSNAIKYNRDDGCIDIEANWPDRDTVMISVKDTGVGIADEDITRIFEPFVRVGLDTQRVQGAGIGLSITKQLVEYMRGRIEVRRRSTGGSVFCVTIPSMSPVDGSCTVEQRVSSTGT